MCHCAKLQQKGRVAALHWSGFSETPYLFFYATDKAGNLAQEVWESKTTQQGQMVDYLPFVIAVLRAIRVVCILLKHNLCVLHEYVLCAFR